MEKKKKTFCQLVQTPRDGLSHHYTVESKSEVFEKQDIASASAKGIVTLRMWY
jgi:hypothetical protein